MEKMQILVVSANVIEHEIQATVVVHAEKANIELRVRCPAPPDVSAVDAAYDVALRYLDPA